MTWRYSTGQNIHDTGSRRLPGEGKARGRDRKGNCHYALYMRQDATSKPVKIVKADTSAKSLKRLQWNAAAFVAKDRKLRPSATILQDCNGIIRTVYECVAGKPCASVDRGLRGVPKRRRKRK